MKESVRLFAVAGACLLVLTGCASKQTPDEIEASIRSRMQLLVSQYKFQQARDVEVPEGTFTKSLEEKVRDKYTDQMVNPAEKEYVRKEMTRKTNEFLAKNLFKEAREYVNSQKPSAVNPLLDANRFPALQRELIETLVDPAEEKYTKTRIQKLRESVDAALAKGNDEEARKIIYGYGIVDQPGVDGPVYVMKCAFLNSLVNPATYHRYQADVEKNILPLIQKGEFEKALAAADALPLVMAYLDVIDQSLDASGVEAVAQRAEEMGVKLAVEARKEALYADIATREGRLMREDEPDWTKVEAELEKVRTALVNDDVPEARAKALVDGLLASYKALVNNFATEESFTTAELNDKILALRTQARARVSIAIEAKLAQAQAEQAEELRKIAATMAAKAAANVDFVARENAFVDAIGNLVEAEMNRVLGDAARALRLYQCRYPVDKEAATSLLVASVYMGFDDTMSLAFALGADLNAPSAKDRLARPAYLVALQYGFKGGSESQLSSADHTVRDANGYGAVHYGVRTAQTATLLPMFQEQLDAKSPAKDGVTPLILASSLNYGPMVEALLAYSSVDAADEKGYTALLRAAENGNLDIVKMLVAAQAKVDAVAGDNNTALDLAVLANAEKLVDYLLDEKGVKVDDRAVALCVLNDKVNTLKVLMAHGARVGNKHLAAAVKKGPQDMVKYLVSVGCDVNSDEVHNIEETNPGFMYNLEYLVSQGFRK